MLTRVRMICTFANYKHEGGFRAMCYSSTQMTFFFLCISVAPICTVFY